MEEEEIKKLVEKVANETYDKRQSEDQFRVSKIPFHTHNGTDSSQISERDLILNSTNFFGLILTPDGTGGDLETFRVVIRNVPNISRMTLFAIAANNAGGGSASEKAMINGTAEFGRCFTFEGFGDSIELTTNTNGIPFVQMSEYTYLDEGALSDVQVGVNPQFLAFAATGGTTLASIEIISYTNSSIILEAQIRQASVDPNVGWKLTANVIIT